MLIQVEKLKQYFEQATKYKEEVKASYNETYQYTDPFIQIKDSGKKEKNAYRKIDSTVLTSIRFLVNFIMTSMFGRNGGTWAMLVVNDIAYADITDTDKSTAEKLAENINAIMEENSEAVYDINEQTNYYTETAKAMKDCVITGTGVRKTVELASKVQPLTYEYISLDNFYFLEDTFGKPTITFKVYVEKTLEQLNDMFGHLKGWKIPSEFENGEEDLKKVINVIECCIPQYNEQNSVTEYIHCVFTDEFAELLYEGMLKRNPFRVFRWGTDSSNPWGVGIGRENLDLFKDLEEAKAERKRHAKKIVDPPINFRGNIDIIHKASLDAGAVNYAGDGMSQENNMGVSPINLGTNLIPLDQDIADARQRIREVFMAQPLGDVMDTRNRTATEMQLRHEMFRKEFSGAYELLNTELLQCTFLDAYIILYEKDLLNKSLDEEQETQNYKYLDFSNIVYINELTKSSGVEQVMNVVNWYQANASLMDEQQRKFLINVGKFTKWSAERMRVPLEILYSEEEINQMIQQQQQLEQLQQLSQVQNEGLQGQVEQMAQGMGGE